MAHYDDESLFQYVEGTSPIASEIASHVSSCTDCATEVGEHRDLIATLSDKAVWESPAQPPRQFVANVSAFAERIRQEDENAVAQCDELLTGPAAWWRQRLRKMERAYTAGMVKQLLERMRSYLESSPAHALQVTALAIEVANTLEVSAYPCDYVIKLRAQALRDHAYVLSFTGRYPEALEYAERAKRLFAQVPLPEYDLARLALVQASILCYIDRADEAIVLAHNAAETFRRFGDTTRHINARITEAGMIYESGNIAGALEIWLALEQDPAIDDLGRVRVTHNIGTAYGDLRQPEKAAEYLQRCIPEYEMLGMDSERARARWMLSHALVSAGRTYEAIPTLRKTWREFETLDLIADAGLVALELAEALLSVGQADEVPAICRDLIAQFTRAGMTSRAITALSFLREAVAVGHASTSLVKHVHAFLRELPAEQPRLFAPPPPDVRE
ncbi:MAG TPA: tetratricopeptide repeat protein [Thermoanaerobaculia bacterium]